MQLSIKINDRQSDVAILAWFRDKVRKLGEEIDNAITRARLNKDAVSALEEASWHLEDVAGKKFWDLQSEAALRDEIAAGIADEQIKAAKEAW